MPFDVDYLLLNKQPAAPTSLEGAVWYNEATQTWEGRRPGGVVDIVGGASAVLPQLTRQTDTSLTITDSTVFLTKVSIVLPALAGLYRIDWGCVVRGTKVEFRIRDTTAGSTWRGPYRRSVAPNEDYVTAGLIYYQQDTTPRTVEIQFRTSNAQQDAEISDATISAFRVSD